MAAASRDPRHFRMGAGDGAGARMGGSGRQLRAFALAISLAACAAGCSRSTFEPPERSGPPALVQSDGRAALWIATVQEEERSRRVGAGASSRWTSDFYTHLRIEAHDPASARREWLKTLKVVKDGDGRHGARVRILGQQGETVWVWLHDAPLALSARDGAPIADLARLQQANPEIAGLFPRELEHYTWLGELVVTLADGRHVRIEPSGFRAEPYGIDDDAQFRSANDMTGTWNGGFRTGDFGVRHGLLDGRWVGLLSDREAEDGEDDAWGDHYADSAEIDDEGAAARRTFRVASIGRTREFSEGSHERIVKLDPIAGSGHWLQGLMLKANAPPGTPAFTLRGRHWKPTVRPPLRLSGPEGVLVLHRTRLDAQGRLALTRLDGAFRERWTTVLPFDELSNRWEMPGRLLLYGSRDDAPPGTSDRREALVALDLADGSWHGWRVEDERESGPGDP